MIGYIRFRRRWIADPQILWDDGERVFCRGQRPCDGGGHDVLLAQPAAEHPLPTSLDRLAHEFGLKDELNGAWAVRPLELLRECGRTLQVLMDPGGEPLARLLAAPMEIEHFLRLVIGIAVLLANSTSVVSSIRISSPPISWSTVPTDKCGSRDSASPRGYRVSDRHPGCPRLSPAQARTRRLCRLAG